MFYFFCVVYHFNVRGQKRRGKEILCLVLRACPVKGRHSAARRGALSVSVTVEKGDQLAQQRQWSARGRTGEWRRHHGPELAFKK